MPCLRAVEKASPDQRVKGERRVPKPAKSIVPVARAADLLGQRRRSGRDDAPGLPMRERLQGQKRAKNGAAPGPRRLEGRSPSGPEGMDLFARGCEFVLRERRGRDPKRGRPVENEARLFALAKREIADGAKTLSAGFDRRIEQHPVRSGDELKPAVLLRHPGHDRTVVEPHDDLGAHGDLALEAPDDAHQLRRPVPAVHEVGERDRPVRGGEDRLQDQSVAQVSPRGLDLALRRRDQPASVLGAAKERGKARAAVETGQAQPVDRAVAPDERHRLAVSDNGVILDAKRHPGLSAQDGNNTRACPFRRKRPRRSHSQTALGDWLKNP